MPENKKLKKMNLDELDFENAVKEQAPQQKTASVNGEEAKDIFAAIGDIAEGGEKSAASAVNIMDYLGGKLEETKAAESGAIHTENSVVVMPAKNVDNGTIEVGVEMYVEILEAIVNSLAGWWAKDGEKDFSFETKMKATYKKITQIYAQQQNIKLSPGFMFFACTALVVGQVGVKAQKRRAQVLKVESFKKRAAAQIDERNDKKGNGEQATLFADEAGKVSIKRRFFEVDSEGFYTKTPDGEYIKQSNRVEKMPPHIEAFVMEYARKNDGEKPTNKQLLEYEKNYQKDV